MISIFRNRQKTIYWYSKLNTYLQSLVTYISQEYWQGRPSKPCQGMLDLSKNRHYKNMLGLSHSTLHFSGLAPSLILKCFKYEFGNTCFVVLMCSLLFTGIYTVIFTKTIAFCFELRMDTVSHTLTSGRGLQSLANLHPEGMFGEDVQPVTVPFVVELGVFLNVVCQGHRCLPRPLVFWGVLLAGLASFSPWPCSRPCR